MEKIKKDDQKVRVKFTKRSNCKKYLKELKDLGYKWFNGQEIRLKKPLNFWFCIEVCEKDKTVGFVPCFEFTKA